LEGIGNMKKSAISVFVWGVYIIAVGICFLILPRLLLELMGRVTADYMMARFFGMLMVFYGYFYIRAALSANTGYFVWTIHTRMLAIVFLTMICIVDKTSPLIVAFGGIDIAGAVWTWMAMRKEKQT
jgi:hypothetical protein